MVDKQHILDEIKRTAEANQGKVLGVDRFLQETGIKAADWHGKFWARWSDALREAGFQPNSFNKSFDEAEILDKFIALIRELGRYPVRGELKMKCRADKSFPSHNVFARLGSKQQFAARILEHCNSHAGYEDIVVLCAPIAAQSLERQTQAADATTKAGYVYLALMRLGREKSYKIGKAVLVERRKDQIALQLPAELQLIHSLNTDDAYGIEAYWHRRFASRNTNGEWFSLSAQDVRAFKRRKFM